MRMQVGRNLERKPAVAPPNAKVLRFPVRPMPKDPRPFPWVPVLVCAGIAVGVLVTLAVCKALRWM